MDVLPVGDYRHDASTLAILIAQRIESHTLPSQFLYGATTDNAKNVVAAAKQIVNELETARTKALDVQMWRVTSESVSARSSELIEDENDIAEIERALGGESDEIVDDNGPADTDDDAANVAKIDEQRAHQCADHD